MATSEHKGYLWNFYGYTKLHLWGCHIVSGILAACGSGLLVGSAMLWIRLPDAVFHRLVMLSIACFAGATAVAAGSIFALVYFLGRDLLRKDTTGSRSSSTQSSSERSA